MVLQGVSELDGLSPIGLTDGGCRVWVYWDDRHIKGNYTHPKVAGILCK